MSSTTRRRSAARRPPGQVIVIFALSIVALMGIAALAFDAGMMLLERRDEQNAADAAALAGARYLTGTPPTTPEAAAREIASANGYTHGGDQRVIVNIPPASGDFRGFPGFIEVIIEHRRPTIFGTVLGFTGWQVSARAVAANQKGLDLPFSMLALHPDKCGAIQVSGSGTVTSNGSIQVNSSCVPNALDVGGNGVLSVTADGAVCNAVGEIDRHGSNSQLNCTQVENSYAIKDPLRNLPEPPVPAYPEPIVQVSGPSRLPPTGCPGGTGQPATGSSPRTCNFGGSYDGRAYRLFPGFYPGGLSFGKGTYYLEPGIYFIGGGGFRAAGGAVRSVEPGTTTFGGGVMIFNGEAPDFSAACEAGTAPAEACIGPIVLNGGAAEVNLKPLADGSVWDGIVIYQDRDLNYSLADPSLTDVQINGGSSNMEVAGTIYVPNGDVVVNGSTGTMTIDQVIGYTFKINGNGGNINIAYRSGVTARISGVGLVE